MHLTDYCFVRLPWTVGENGETLFFFPYFVLSDKPYWVSKLVCYYRLWNVFKRVYPEEARYYLLDSFRPQCEVPLPEPKNESWVLIQPAVFGKAWCLAVYLKDTGDNRQYRLLYPRSGKSTDLIFSLSPDEFKEHKEVPYEDFYWELARASRKIVFNN